MKILEICQFGILGILEILKIDQVGVLGTWEYWKSSYFDFWWTWEYGSSRYLKSLEPGSIGPPVIWGPGNLEILDPNQFWYPGILGIWTVRANIFLRGSLDFTS